MRKIITLIFIFSIHLSSYSDNHEYIVKNLTTHNIRVQVYPVSMVFNGYNMYNFVARGKWISDPILEDDDISFVYNYINGSVYHMLNSETRHYYQEISPNFFSGAIFNYDKDFNTSTIGSLAYGTYKVEITHLIQIPYRDSCIVEFDWYNLDTADGDLDIEVYNDSVRYRFDNINYNYRWVRITYLPIDSNGWKIKSWKPNGINYPESRAKRFGPGGNGFFSYKAETGHYNYYYWIPLDCRIDCQVINSPQMYKNMDHLFPIDNSGVQIQFFDTTFYNEIRQGELYLNLKIEKNVTSPLSCYPYSQKTIPIIIKPDAHLKLAEGYTITLHPVSNAYNSYVSLINEPNGILSLENNSEILINGQIIGQSYGQAAVILEKYSKLNMPSNGSASFVVYGGGVFCNKGAIINGVLKVQYNDGIHTLQCSSIQPDFIFDDSTQIILTDSAILEIPDNTSLIFDNPETILQMDSNSTIKFGNNSKLIVRNGARLYAYKANFISLNANSVWDGIYLSDLSRDTIKYCNIENAVSGINIKDKNNSGGSPGMDPVTIISDCSFKNTTNNTFTSGIYAANSNNILLKNNTFYSTSINIGFSSGILLEYCPSENINLINNNVDYSATGIVVIQSSPYISRNTITGRTNSSYGIFLDNAGGNIKYNTVNNFATSFISYYSSPNLFRNSFLNASESNLELLTYSTPLMRPVNTESEIIWLGGNNTITGTPAISGIEFYGESYPESDLGYNIENVNGADYMKGDIPTVMDGMLLSTYNYWGTSNPDPNKFDVQYGNVEFEPVYDGVTPIDYDDYQLNDIGFGLYDTVLIKNLGDISGGTLLFMQAYNKEKQSDFSGAILLYKQVISSYKKSYYAAASVMRIFSCLEKIKNINNFILHQNFLSQLKINQNIPLILRELAEDYIIKCKVKRGILTEAISDYNNIYLLNQNNSKGAHALLNKECLTSMLHDTTDGMSGDIIEHKYNIYEKITNKSLNHIYSISKEGKPAQYSLSDNYPNPFNPVTNIGYELPNDAFVNIRIFDILGREVTVLVNEFKSAGRYIVAFNASNLPSGIFFYKLEAKEQTGSNKMFTFVKKMLLVK